MRSARFKLLFSSVLLAGVLWASHGFAAEGELSENQLKGDLTAIKTRLEVLESQQKEILAKEDKILEELDRIRIWVHRK